jgi:hypothetical protein
MNVSAKHETPVQGETRRARRTDYMSELQCCHAPAFRTSLRVASKRGACFVGIDSEWDGHSEPIPSRIHPRFEATHLTFIV